MAASPIRAGATIEAVGTGSTVDFWNRRRKISAKSKPMEPVRQSGSRRHLDNSNLIIARMAAQSRWRLFCSPTNPAPCSRRRRAAASTGSLAALTIFGTIDSDNGGSITFGGSIGITNKASGIFEATNGGSITFGTSGIGSVTNMSGGLIKALSGGTITFDFDAQWRAKRRHHQSRWRHGHD